MHLVSNYTHTCVYIYEKNRMVHEPRKAIKKNSKTRANSSLNLFYGSAQLSH